MLSKKSVWIGCLWLFVVGIVDGQLTGGPRNQAVIAGDRMAMKCRVSNDYHVFKWMLTRPTSHEKEQIFRKRHNKPIVYQKFSRFGYDMDEYGSVDIFTNSTEASDAGVYFCYIDPGQLQYSAHLIVFENEPLCEVNNTSQDNMTFAKGDQISISCSANFSGLWTPSVEWREHTGNSSDGDGGKVMTFGVTTVTSYNASIASSLNLVVDFETNTSFSFKIFFSWRNDTIPVNATNPPRFHYTWKSPEVIVAVPDRDLKGPMPPAHEKVIVEMVTNEVKSTNDWYTISMMLLVAVLMIVVVIVGVVVRRFYTGYRRVNGLDQRSSPSNPAALSGLERPASGVYDVIPFATPNVYERIDDGDVNVTDPSTECHHQQHPPLTQCYSGLSDATLCSQSPYDALVPYITMGSTPISTENCLPSEKGQEKETAENLYKKPVTHDTVSKSKGDYLTLVGEGDEPINNPKSGINSPNKDNSDYVQPDESLSRFAKTNDDYLLPFC